MRKFVSSQRAPWGVLDTWQNQRQPLGVFTVLTEHAHGEDWLAEVKGDHQGVWGLAVVDQAAGKPADRLREALDQSKRRQERRLAFSTQPLQIWPLPDAAPSRAGLPADERDIGYAEELGRLELKVDTGKKAPVAYPWKHIPIDSSTPAPAADVVVLES